MPKKGYTPKQIIHKLREAEVLLSQRNAIAIICKKIGFTDQTYYRWRKEYGGMRVDQAKRLKDLEDELLNREVFTTLIEAKVLIEQWSREYNQVRPHSSLGYRPRTPEAVMPIALT